MAKVITKKEYKERRRNFQIAAGLVDFLVTAGAILVVLFCVLLILALIEWIKGDVPLSFGIFYKVIERVLNVNPGKP